MATEGSARRDASMPAFVQTSKAKDGVVAVDHRLIFLQVTASKYAAPEPWIHAASSILSLLSTDPDVAPPEQASRAEATPMLNPAEAEMDPVVLDFPPQRPPKEGNGNVLRSTGSVSGAAMAMEAKRAMTASFLTMVERRN